MLRESYNDKLIYREPFKHKFLMKNILHHYTRVVRTKKLADNGDVKNY